MLEEPGINIHHQRSIKAVTAMLALALILFAGACGGTELEGQSQFKGRESRTEEGELPKQAPTLTAGSALLVHG